MQQYFLDNRRTHFTYQDGQILANPLCSPSYQFGNMIEMLEMNQTLKTDFEIARRYIRSAISYLAVFETKKTVDWIFRNVTPLKDAHSNLENLAWRKIALPHGEQFPEPETTYLLASLHCLVTLHKPPRISRDDHNFKKIKGHIISRQNLAVVLSILPSRFCDKVGEVYWLEILAALADTKLLPARYPEEFTCELRIVPRPDGCIVEKLQRFAREISPPCLPAPVPAAPPVLVSATIPASDSAELDAEDGGILGSAFDLPEFDPAAFRSCKVAQPAFESPATVLGVLKLPVIELPVFPASVCAQTLPGSLKKPRLYQDLFRNLTDLPALKLGDLGLPLNASALAQQQLVPCSTLSDTVLHAHPAYETGPEDKPEPEPEDKPEPSPEQDPESAPVTPIISAESRFISQCHASVSASPFASPSSLNGERLATPDPFSNFTPLPFDYESWVMRISPSKLVPPARPHKRARSLPQPQA